jgi:nicotinamidase-related amidase
MNETTPAIDAARAALLVMDYQQTMVGSLPDSAGLLAGVAGAIATARAQGLQIGYVRVALTDADYEAVPDTNLGFAALAAERRLPETAPESAIHEALAPRSGDIVVRKTRVGAFSTTDLDRRLRERAIDTLVLAGISTSGVVLSTVRDAADRDYRLYVLEDGCRDRDPEVHDLLMHKIFPRQAHVVALADLAGLLAAAR